MRNLFITLLVVLSVACGGGTEGDPSDASVPDPYPTGAITLPMNEPDDGISIVPSGINLGSTGDKFCLQGTVDNGVYQSWFCDELGNVTEVTNQDLYLTTHSGSQTVVFRSVESSGDAQGCSCACNLSGQAGFPFDSVVDFRSKHTVTGATLVTYVADGGCSFQNPGDELVGSGNDLYYGGNIPTTWVTCDGTNSILGGTQSDIYSLYATGDGLMNYANGNDWVYDRGGSDQFYMYDGDDHVNDRFCWRSVCIGGAGDDTLNSCLTGPVCSGWEHNSTFTKPSCPSLPFPL